MTAGPISRCALRVTLAALSAAAAARPASAQQLARSWLESASGTVWEEYLRAAQLDTSLSRPYPQTIRAFGYREIARMRRADARDPWESRVADVPPSSLRVHVLRPSARIVANSTFPFGLDGGAIWAGRGATVALDLGVAFVYGPLSVRLQPTLWWTQNASYETISPSGAPDDFRNLVAPSYVDLPQRFGASAFARLDYGASEARLDVGPITAGFSNALQSWGPATTHPFILGSNAPGFAHAFVGTAHPLPVGIGHLHARLIAGRLDQSKYSPARDSLGSRIGAGIIATFLPLRPTGLELGVTRFVHRVRQPGTVPWSAWRIPLEGLALKRSHLGVDNPSDSAFLADNQLASVFARWAPIAAGFEVYGEYGREDAALDVRDLITEPDHSSAYTLGVRARLASSARTLRLVRAEWTNGRVTHLERVRPQGLLYTNTSVVQGHTNQGRVLGSPALFGGAGAVVAVESFDASGESHAELHRIVRQSPIGEGAPDIHGTDVQYAARAGRTRFGRRYDVTLGGTLVWEANRNFARDAFDLGLDVGVRLGGDPRPRPTAVRP
jgi:hypothetical protein